MVSETPTASANLAVTETLYPDPELAAAHAQAGKGTDRTRLPPSQATAVDTLPGRPGRDRPEQITGTPPVWTTATSSGPSLPSWKLFQDWGSYQVDFWQRSILFFDTLRERGDNMIAHEQAGLPPLLNFEYETLLDARTFERPVNYALLRITVVGDACLEDCLQPGKPPVIIIDPRAGHGPGIGGSKRDSEVGIAMHEGHPVYFVIFFPDPCPGQTLADVLGALRRFVETVHGRHDGSAPILYGNCQAGWAVTLLAADCAGLTGPTVLNGSPLSYWAGEPGVNTMRILGGLLGGTWAAHLLADLGDGVFDGAWLVQNFETLNPANALWAKYADLFADVDRERARFLEFERWWNGFHGLGRDEILAITENLFVGNRLEEGKVRICGGCFVDLRRIRNPVVVFASRGDAITPPDQALGWIPAVWGSTEALRQADQRIVYLINPHVGHLGIFVSAAVARLEHRAILENLEEIEALGPGLYEMKIINPTGDPDCRKPQYRVAFEARRVEDLRADYPRPAFERARNVSESNEALYRTFLSPWVQAMTSPWTAAMLRWLHPMRICRIAFSEGVNPPMAGVAALACGIKAVRQPTERDNPFLRSERLATEQATTAIEASGKVRDQICETAFRALYE